jgi:hypothetical protein
MSMLDAIPGVLIAGEDQHPPVLDICQKTGEELIAQQQQSGGGGFGGAHLPGDGGGDGRGGGGGEFEAGDDVGRYRRGGVGSASLETKEDGVVTKAFKHFHHNGNSSKKDLNLGGGVIGDDAWWCTAQRLVAFRIGE